MSSAPICHFCAAAGVLMGDVRGVCDRLTRSAMFSREIRRDYLIRICAPLIRRGSLREFHAVRMNLPTGTLEIRGCEKRP